MEINKKHERVTMDTMDSLVFDLVGLAVYGTVSIKSPRRIQAREYFSFTILLALSLFFFLGSEGFTRGIVMVSFEPFPPGAVVIVVSPPMCWRHL